MPPFLFMGFFSSTRTYVASTTLNLVEDTPKVIQQSILSSVLNKTNKVADLKNTILYSLANNANLYYDYGKDKYIHGLPTGTSIGLVANILEVTNVLKGIYGDEVKVLSATIDTFDETFIGTAWMRDNTDWNSTTDEYTYNGMTFKLGYFLVENGKIVVYGSRAGLPIPTYEIDSPYAVYDNTQEYFYYVTFLETTASTQPLYWVYRVNEGTYPTLVVEDSQPSSQFFPVIPLRINNVSQISENKKDTQLYKDSKQLMDIIELSITEMDEGIEENPDIDDVDHAYLMFGVGIDSKVEGSQQYLYEFFKQLQFRSRVTKTIYQTWVNDDENRGAPPVNYYHMTDRTWNFYLMYNYIDEVTTQGVIGNVGDVQVNISPKAPITENYEVVQGQGQSTTRSITFENELSIVALTKQVTENTVNVITVSGLISYNKIYDAGKNYVINLQSVVNDEEVLMIPLAHNITEVLPWTQRNPLFYDSIKIVFNAFEKVKLKWYETGFFKIVTIIVAVSLAVFTGGLSSLVTSLTVAASSGIVALGIVVAKTVITSLLVKFSFQFVAKELGVEAAFILAAVGLVAGLTGSMMDLPYADDLLAVGSLGVEATNQFAQMEIMDLTKQFEELVAEQQEELEESREELGLNVVQQIDPLNLFTSVGMLPMEQPSEFISRSLTCNIADISNNMISTYVDNQLVLPELGGLS